MVTEGMLPSRPPTTKEKFMAPGLSTENKPVRSYFLSFALRFKTISGLFSTF